MVYGRDYMEELFLIPRELLGEQSLLEYMTKSSSGRKPRALTQRFYITERHFQHRRSSRKSGICIIG